MSEGVYLEASGGSSRFRVVHSEISFFHLALFYRYEHDNYTFYTVSMKAENVDQCLSSVIQHDSRLLCSTSNRDKMDTG